MQEHGNPRGPNPCLFIVGCPRSGTTLLQRIVDAHPQITVTPETHWIPRYLPKFQEKAPEGRATKRFLRHLLRYRRFSQLGLNPRKLKKLVKSGDPLSYASFVSAVFDLYGKAQGKTMVGDKTPGYARDIPVLHSLWPEAKFVHLIRDGRDVCLSALSWKKPGKLFVRAAGWGEDPVMTAALWWEWHVRLGREDGQPLGPQRYQEIRYEALVNDAEGEVKRLCTFLDVPFDKAMLCYHEGRTRTEAGLDSNDAWLPVTPGLRDWRRQMPAEDVEHFEAAAGSLLEELGYPRAAPDPRREVLKRAGDIRETFSRHCQAQEFVVPRLFPALGRPAV
jgi:hypothetical protein